MQIKKVLLLGDYSSVHLNLRDGLRKLNVECLLVSEGDGYKGYETDINLGNNISNSLIQKIFFKINVLKKLKGYDVVQFINPSLGFSPLKALAYVRYLRFFNKKLFALICSPDPHIWQLYKKGFFRYSPYSGLEKDQQLKEEKVLFDDKKFSTNLSYKIVLNSIKGLISKSSEYHMPYEEVKKHISMISFPVNIDHTKYVPNIVSGKIKILHGIQKGREYTKGTFFILEALEKLKNKYPELVEINQVKSVPFKKWQELLIQSNIVIDQTNCFAPGMNALLSMAMGRIVLTGAEKEYMDYHNFSAADLPFYNITPDVNQIFEVLENLLLSKNEFEQIGFKARKFVEDHHDYIKIAKTYLQVWEKN